MDSSFKNSLKQNLQECCRKHGRYQQNDISAVTSPTDPPSSHDPSESFREPVVILNCEESSGEAVIDTGASRTVIGEDRVEGLVTYVSGMVPGLIRKVPSKVQFRFGNSGTLQSRYALCIPRQQKGWIRVEVAVHLCAMEPQNYLETELSGEEDPGLQSNQTYMNAPEQTYKVPPGVKTLSQWGQQVIPSGKKAGMTFTQVFDQDDGYCMQVKSRKAVAPWLRSFQNYLTARWKHRMLHQFPVKPQVNPTPKSSRTPTSQEKITKGYKITDQEWETVETPKASPLKRGTSEMNQGASSSSAMKTEPNIDKVEKIRAQIAILQRELARETQVPADDL
eukprot:s399_g7.t1